MPDALTSVEADTPENCMGCLRDFKVDWLNLALCSALRHQATRQTLTMCAVFAMALLRGFGRGRSRKFKGGLPRIPGGRGVDYRQDFFGRPAYLTVSGQLQVTLALHPSL